MESQVETIAAQLGWRVRKGNVIVEGTSDVSLITHAAHLYWEVHNVDLLEEMSVNAAGAADDGGVEGVNRRLQLFRQLSEIEAGGGGAKRRFIGLYDSDKAGKIATASISKTDSRIKLGADVFLLRPVMPLKGGADANAVCARFDRENLNFGSLVWELEDLLPNQVLEAFSSDFPDAVIRLEEIGGRQHRDITRDGKFRLLEFVKQYANLNDMAEFIKLIKSLRDYCHLRHDHIVIV